MLMHGASWPRREGTRVPIVTMLNQKGGVGKTSACHHLSGTLASMGRRVLLVDNDPQASLTQGFWGPQATAALDPGGTVAALYRGDLPFPEQVIRPSGIAGVDLLPGSRLATDWNVPRPHEADPAAQGCLRTFLAEVAGGYDLVLIDCPPNLHLCSWAALVASSHILIPTQPEDYGAQGLGPVQESVEMVAAGPNPSIGLLGFLITMFNARLAIHKLYDGLLRQGYGPAVFEARIPYAADFKEAIAQRRPIAAYKPRGASAKAIRALADEVLARLDAPCIAPASGQEAA
jgi:chromosome partitioning protein